MPGVIKKLTVILLSALMLSSLQLANADEQNEVTFAVIQDNRMSVLTELWEQPLQYLSEKTGLKINWYATTSYASVVEAMMAGFVDFAKLGPKIYLVAAEKSEGAIRPIANFAAEANAFNPNPCACYFGLLIQQGRQQIRQHRVAQGLGAGADRSRQHVRQCGTPRVVPRGDRRQLAGGLLLARVLFGLS